MSDGTLKDGLRINAGILCVRDLSYSQLASWPIMKVGHYYNNNNRQTKMFKIIQSIELCQLFFVM